MDMPIMVTLDRETMSGYLLNVLGTDQIHDFCGDRLTKAIPWMTNSSVNPNKRKGKTISNQTTKKIKSGGNPILIDLTDYEVIEQQCLELIHIFVNTIIEDNTTNDTVNNEYNEYNSESNNPENIEDNDVFITLTNALQNNGGSVSRETFRSEPYQSNNTSSSVNTEYKNIENKSTLVSSSNKIGSDTKVNVNYENEKEWGEHVKTNISLFINNVSKNNTYSLNYICIHDIISIFTTYLSKLSNIITSEDVRNFEYFITLYVVSMNYFISHPLRHCYNNTQPQTGGTQETKLLKDVISKMIKQMVFTFCDIPDTYNCDKWKNSKNWKCFEIGLLKNNIKSVETTSSNWIRTQIFKQTSDQPTNNNTFKFIKPLEGLFEQKKPICKLKEKTQKKHIIVNSASLNKDLKPLILYNYPSFIDSQRLGGEDNELLEKMKKYNCGFQDPSNNYYYIMEMNTTSKTHKIIINYNNNHFEFTQTCSNFKIYNKNNQNDIPATTWKDVTLCVALINAFESMSTLLKIRKITSLSRLIKVIKQQFTNTGNKNIIYSFYSFSLFKGLGDTSQEMTSVIKYGGGNTNTISPTYNYEAFDTSGNALRLFLARDQLSANRFILTLNYGLEYGLKNGNDNNINSKAYGGYLNVYNCNPQKMYLIEANQPLSKTPTGGNNKYSRKYKNSKRKRKNYTKNTRNKHNKTYKLYKKNT